MLLKHTNTQRERDKFEKGHLQLQTYIHLYTLIHLLTFTPRQLQLKLDEYWKIVKKTSWNKTKDIRAGKGIVS